MSSLLAPKAGVSARQTVRIRAKTAEVRLDFIVNLLDVKTPGGEQRLEPLETKGGSSRPGLKHVIFLMLRTAC